MAARLTIGGDADVEHTKAKRKSRRAAGIVGILEMTKSGPDRNTSREFPTIANQLVGFYECSKCLIHNLMLFRYLVEPNVCHIRQTVDYPRRTA